MGALFLLSERQMELIRPYFPLAHGVPRVDGRRVLSGIVYVIRNGLQWKDAPKAYGPHKTLYNRFIRWSRPVETSDDRRDTPQSAQNG
ncbi:transposase, partial [Acetobacter oeni]|nr:transposase [Acetobacter oeni]